MRTEKTVPDLLVEKLVAGELSTAQRLAVEERLRLEGGDRVAELRQSNEEILHVYPATQMVAEIQRRAAVAEAEKKTATMWRPLYWVPAVGLCAAALFFAVQFRPWENRLSARHDEATSQPWVAFKGMEPGLTIHLKAGDREKTLSRGQKVRSGDVLQVACEAGNARNAVIFSVDGAGAVTLHFPERIEDKTAVKPGGQFKLPFGYELDDAPGFERFFMVWTADRTSLNVREILAAAKKLKNAQHDELRLAGGLKQNDFVVLKSGGKDIDP